MTSTTSWGFGVAKAPTCAEKYSGERWRNGQAKEAETKTEDPFRGPDVLG